MKFAQLFFVMAILTLSACRGGAELKCDNEGAYLSSTTTPRVKAPEGLDNLEPLREMPIPEASPQAERVGADGCLESPPAVTGN